MNESKLWSTQKSNNQQMIKKELGIKLKVDCCCWPPKHYLCLCVSACNESEFEWMHEKTTKKT